jgi:hypothetical protein
MIASGTPASLHPALPSLHRASPARRVLTRKQLAPVILGWAFFGWLNGSSYCMSRGRREDLESRFRQR